MTIRALLDKAAENKTRLIIIVVIMLGLIWLLWEGRTASKVTILQNGTWQVFPDQGDLDEQRWAAYSCPETYESSTGESP